MSKPTLFRQQYDLSPPVENDDDYIEGLENELLSKTPCPTDQEKDPNDE